jgi:hypothetical protein
VPPDAGVTGTAKLTDDEGYTTTVDYKLSLGTPTTDVAKDPPGSGEILIPIRGGNVTMLNTTTGHDGPNDDYQVGIFGLYQAARPICQYGSGAPVIGAFQLSAPTSGSYCIVWMAWNESVSDSGVPGGQSTNAPLKQVISGSDVDDGYPSTDTVIDMYKTADQLSATLADLAKGPDFWTFGITNQQEKAGACTISEGFLVTTDYTMVSAVGEPGNQAVTLSCSE